MKHQEKIIGYSKSSFSIMYAGCANGNLLPPYVCYKATNMYESLKNGGPFDTRYNALLQNGLKSKLLRTGLSRWYLRV